MSSSQLKPLILLCDGTWCGRETSTKTNIYNLAELVGIPVNNSRKGRYIHGVGLDSTFLDYVFNGITAQDIAEQCIAAYKYIVKNYEYGKTEIWMFGLSRGAYTVRCVGGMINNCGIVKLLADPNETDLLCREVYRIYRSPYKIEEPQSEQSKEFRKHASWPLIGDEESGESKRTPPIRFMGLLDTVGSLGIPSYNGGVGLDWPTFYDQEVSSAVDHVYQAVSLHDRLYVFQPCLAKRNPKKFPDPEKWNIHQKWLPGVHYDLGRQRFKFFRDGATPWESFLARFGWASKVIEPNHVLADLALKWMLESIRDNDAQRLIIKKVDDEIQHTLGRIKAPNRRIGDGDVYNRIAEYAPFGGLVLGIWRAIWGTRGQVNAIWQLLLALRDRHIPETHADVYDYKSTDPQISTSMTIQELAGIENLTGNQQEDERKRYPGRAFEEWSLRRRVNGIV
ncbi:hypothetical protein DL95DRAFT_485959 [Leptodontidium sp. 2 PMI_412]|nr:hypothetical protein DL95DRAFT_485959 [Leptodontidium sp. 2 PMI_412]